MTGGQVALMESRISPVPADAARGPLATVFPGVTDHHCAPPSLGQQLVANPSILYRRWLALRSELLTSEALPADLRELAILRVAHNTGCDQEWRGHWRAAIAAGVPEAMIASWKTSPAAVWPDARWAVVVALADALHRRGAVDDEIWDQLRHHFDVPLILELVVLVGHYTISAYVLNAVGEP
ncbi:hypothetical protein ASE02_21330 [Phenylobacterium sp. Root700]|nr:hypothetical protein ASE02_21330 [Phenylobacterium sp. Root700]